VWSLGLSSPAKRGRWTARKRGGGGARQDYFGRHACDRVGDLISIAHRLARSNTRHRKPACLKPGVAGRVTQRSIAQVVAHPVDLHREARLGAIEVEHIGPNRVLTAEDGSPGFLSRNRVHNRASGGERLRRSRRARAIVSSAALMACEPPPPCYAWSPSPLRVGG
jgi:hypothetical protein